MKKTTILVITIAIILLGLFYFAGFSHAPNTEELSVDTTKTELQEDTAIIIKTLAMIEEESSIEFSIGEILREKDFTVVGNTNKILGKISVLNEDEKNIYVSIGEILVDARDFKTDSENRDRAISGFILRSTNNDNYNFIKFVPEENSITLDKGGKDSKVELKGALTISGITNPATFSVSLNTKEGAVSGNGYATIKRSDFDLKIPSVPFVAEVDDEFFVKVNIIAR